MCGRYAFSHSAADLQALFAVANPDSLEEAARYNIAPTQPVIVVYRNREGLRKARPARWGLIPNWIDDPGAWRAATFNARSEDVARKPTFRQAFKRGRVLVPASGFYEWKREDGGKTPHHIRAQDDRPLAFAGLMDVWRDRKGGGEPLVSCTILTTASRGRLVDLHDRMPVVVPPGEFEAWLASEEPGKALDRVLTAFDVDDLEVYPVSTAVNTSREDRAEFTLPLR